MRVGSGPRASLGGNRNGVVPPKAKASQRVLDWTGGEAPMGVAKGNQEGRVGSRITTKGVVDRSESAGVQVGVQRERVVGCPSAQQGTAAKLEGTRIEMAAHGVVRGAGREAKGLNKRRESSGAHPLLSRGKAEP